MLILKLSHISKKGPISPMLRGQTQNRWMAQNVRLRICGCWRIVHSTLHWRHNELDCVSNHQPHDCLLNYLFRRRSKKTPKLRATGLCVGNSPVTGEFPAQKASNVENVSTWWRHHEMSFMYAKCTNQISIIVQNLSLTSVFSALQNDLKNEMYSEQNGVYFPDISQWKK